MNLKIREFKISLEKYINTTDLPPEVKRIVLKDIYDGIEKEADLAISAELKERDAAEQEVGQDE